MRRLFPSFHTVPTIFLDSRCPMLTWGHFSPANYQAAHSADFLFVQIEQRKRVRPAAKGSIPESPFPERALHSMHNHASHTDASRSHFSNVGHDQHNVGRDQHNAGRDQLVQTINLNIPDAASQETVQYVLRNISHPPQQLSSSSSTFIITSHHNRSACDVASNLIVEIKRLLIDLMKFSVDYRYLQDLLNTLHQTLFLTGLAIQAYEDTPLGLNLAVAVTPEVEQCQAILQYMLDSINRYRQILYSTPIRDLWPSVMWSGSKVLELVWKLSAHQRALGQFLVALNSIIWEDLGTKLSAGRVSPEEFRTYSSQGPASASLRNIQVTKILVVDHLGQTIPVPTVFCSTWESFNYIIHGYCKDRPGHHFVERGDYQMIRAEDSRTIDPSEFASSVEPGMNLEMSIILRQKKAFQEIKGTCPQCQYVNLHVPAAHGWIECFRCKGQFQIAEASPKPQDDESDDESDGTGDAWEDVESDRESGDERIIGSDAAEGVEEVLSPGSRPEFYKEAIYTEDLQLREDRRSTQSFRRICLILRPAKILYPPNWVFPEDLNSSPVPPEFKKEGSGWYAVFNQKIKKTLDVTLVHTLMHESVVCCVRFSVDGRYLATGCNHVAQIYDTKTGAKTVVLFDKGAYVKGSDLYIRSICFSPDGKFLATGAEDKKIRIWDIGAGSISRVFEGHQEIIYSLEFSQNGRFLVSGSGDNTVRIWDMDGASTVLISDPDPSNCDTGVTSIAISPNGQLVAAGCLDAIVRIWDVATGGLLERLRAHRDSVYSVAFTPDGKGLVSGSLDKTVKYWDVTGLMSGMKRRKEGANGSSTNGPGGSANGRMDSDSTQCMMNFTGHKDYVLSVAVSHDGKWVVSGSKDLGVRFWDSHGAIVQFMLQGHKNSVISIDLSPVGNTLATGSGDREARIWSYNTI